MNKHLLSRRQILAASTAAGTALMFGPRPSGKEFLTTLKSSSWSGPISQHHEYKLPEDRQEPLAVMRKDLQLLREWLE